MLQGQALIAEMGKRAQRLADDWTPDAGPFAQFIAFALCHAYLEGANDALKEEITYAVKTWQEQYASDVAGRTRDTGSTPQGNRADAETVRRRKG